MKRHPPTSRPKRMKGDTIYESNSMKNSITPKSKEVTMTSLELVDFINSQRREDESELRHDHFMAKVPQVLGTEVAPNFRAYYKASNGKRNPMYTFPKREACLMAMSYSYDIQAKVFDRMTELEHQLVAGAQVVQVKKTTSDLAPLRKQRAISMAIDNGERIINRFPTLGDKSQQSIIANLVNNAAGDQIIPMALLSEKLLNATDAGKILGVSRNIIGRLSNSHNLKTEEYGEWILGEAEHNESQRPTFVYNSKAIAKLRSLIDPSNDSSNQAA